MKRLLHSKINELMFVGIVFVIAMLCIGAVATSTRYVGTFVGLGTGLTNSSGVAIVTSVSSLSSAASNVVVTNSWGTIANGKVNYTTLTNPTDGIAVLVVGANNLRTITNTKLGHRDLTNETGVSSLYTGSFTNAAVDGTTNFFQFSNGVLTNARAGWANQ